MLRDKKLEVQELAAVTLSGILKVASAPHANRLRATFLDQVNHGHTGRTRGSKSGDASEAHVVAVLGLKAFVLSTPYEVPEWLPEVLMALVKMANRPQPVKSMVASTLGEFRRTHGGTELQDCREFFDVEQWEAIRGVSSTSSYFV